MTTTGRGAATARTTAVEEWEWRSAEAWAMARADRFAPAA